MFSVPVVLGRKALCAVNGSVLCKHSNAAAVHHGNALRVGLSASMGCVAPLVKDAAIHGEPRLAINAGRPTEPEKTSWSNHLSSLIMACMVFIPFVAPLAGQLVSQRFGWRSVFALLAGISLLTFVWGAQRLHETLTASVRNAVGLRATWSVAGQFVVNPGAMGYTVVAGLMFGVHLSFLSMAPIYFRDFYGIVEAFPLYFGSVACAFGVALFVNAKTVGRFGVIPAVMFSLSVLVVIGGLATIACLVGWVGSSVGWFSLLSALALAMIGILFGNIITLALEPCAAAAAWGAALSSALSTLLAVGVSQLVGAIYSGTPTSFFAALGACSALSWCIVFGVSRTRVIPIRYG